MDCFLQKIKTPILVYCILNGLYNILNLGVDIVDYVSPGSLRNIIMEGQNNHFFKIFLFLGTLFWVALHGYFLWCTICLYRRIKFNIAPTPPPASTPPFN